MKQIPELDYLLQCDNIVLLGDTDTGETKLKIALVQQCLRDEVRDEIFNITDLLNKSMSSNLCKLSYSARKHSTRFTHAFIAA